MHPRYGMGFARVTELTLMNLHPGPAKKAILIGADGASMGLLRRMAANVEGGIVYEALEDPNWYLRES